MKIVFKVAEKTKATKANPEASANKISGAEVAEKVNRKPEAEKEPLPPKAVGQAGQAGQAGHEVVVAEDGDGFARQKEPKSLDYYLYQTRSSSASGGYDDPKRSSKSSGAFKQEASTGGAARSGHALSTVVTILVCMRQLSRLGVERI
jgi:hypothetical protein